MLLRALPKARELPLYARSASTLAAARARWNGRLVVTEEVEHALETGAPVVALETAIVTHGMPYPANLTTALSLERIIRSRGGVPATIALRDGRVHVGLSEAELDALANPDPSRQAVKVSRRDLAPALALRRDGGTTVAGTMVIASSVGIQSFVTGGIGGVHRGAESSMDISADLLELGRTPMMVVCAGAKSILDLPRTLEVLETQGVCVATFGESADFPAFYTPSSGVQSPWRVGSVSDAAAAVYTGLTLPSPTATLLAVPIPAEYGPRGDKVQAAVEQAVRESVEQGIDKRGKEVTPWLLKRVGELTQGSALELSQLLVFGCISDSADNSDVKLIENNAHIGTQVAVEVARLARAAAGAPQPAQPALPASSAGAQPPVLVIGSAAIDLTSSVAGPLVPGTTTPGTVFVSPGGVGRNIAEAAQALLPAGEVMLLSAVGASGSGTDAFGDLLKLELAKGGLRTDGLVALPGATSVCNLLLEKDGDLVGGVADMNIVEGITGEVATQALRDAAPKLVVFDCNLRSDVIEAIVGTAAQLGVPALCDPTSTPKIARLLPALRAHPRALTHLSPNQLELDHLYAALSESDDNGWEFVSALGLGAEWRASLEAFCARKNRDWIRNHGVATKMVACLPFVGGFWVKAGAAGLVHLRFEASRPRDGWPDSLAHKVPSGPLEGQWLVLSHYPAPVITPEEIVSTTGAGDTLVGGLVAGLVSGGPEADWVSAAVERVGRSLRSRRAVA
ncbi:hypothetical protein VHUM_01807 [Vanrija humicola]|uniref:Carbohydrate kinase PfkB domain-containing protein n=1 Tax=Vanrija humicola TaxID=5417 RepID=A0A7D8Z0U4_VANHU|nr:hypothetical protein VHUM_01807 [Vanrija humicola]